MEECNTVTSRQSFAISNVLLDPSDTSALMRFSKTVTNDVGRFGTLLMIGLFDGDHKWRVSVRFLSEAFETIDWDNLTKSQQEAVRSLAKELLLDVGHLDSDFENTEAGCFEVIRKLTTDEEEQIR